MRKLTSSKETKCKSFDPSACQLVSIQVFIIYFLLYIIYNLCVCTELCNFAMYERVSYYYKK